jgi:hypothetical protein
MESKYKERVVNLFEVYKNLYHFEEGSPEYLIDKEDFIEVMCQLAEEVEKEVVDQFLGNPGYIWYTKEQAEELLQKQRELCAKVDRDSILNTKLKLDGKDIKKS